MPSVEECFLIMRFWATEMDMGLEEKMESSLEKPALNAVFSVSESLSLILITWGAGIFCSDSFENWFWSDPKVQVPASDNSFLKALALNFFFGYFLFNETIESFFLLQAKVESFFLLKKESVFLLAKESFFFFSMELSLWWSFFSSFVFIFCFSFYRMLEGFDLELLQLLKLTSMCTIFVASYLSIGFTIGARSILLIILFF